MSDEYVRRTVRLTCEAGHQWHAERIAKKAGKLKMPGGDLVDVLEHVSMAPRDCPTCGTAAVHYEALTEYAPS